MSKAGSCWPSCDPCVRGWLGLQVGEALGISGPGEEKTGRADKLGHLRTASSATQES